MASTKGKPTFGDEELILEGVTKTYRGKVRDVYYADPYVVMVASDRISAFDHVLPQRIPFKGAVLNQVSQTFLEETRQISPNWFISSPHPNVSIGHLCTPYKVEVVVRGYLAGHAWRLYKSGIREVCGAAMPEGMKQNDAFPESILTPATKADEGHDEDISEDEILTQGLVTADEWAIIRERALRLFDYGTIKAEEQGLILVDTKYEFGKDAHGEIRLIDEIHTPDSSRYFYKEGYEDRQSRGEAQKQLSKEFVREWLMSEGFQGEEGQTIPNMSEDFVITVSRRYKELFETLMGSKFSAADNMVYQKEEIERIINAELQMLIS